MPFFFLNVYKDNDMAAALDQNLLSHQFNPSDLQGFKIGD